MSNTNTGGPAFPTTQENGCNSGEPGMTLRDYFAAKAMPFEFKEYWDDFAECENQNIVEYWREEIAESCYAMADAMLKAREA